MGITSKNPFYSNDDDTLLGFIVNDGSGWQALTVFGYLIAHADSQKQAELMLQDLGPNYLKGVWQYYDKEDQDWYYCVIKKA